MPTPPSRQRRRSIVRHWRLPLFCLLILMTLAARAQETGQICVLTFDDRDGNGSRDADERSIPHGIGASLLNADGVTIAAALLDDSPFAANGLMCFDQLRAGEYRLRVTSAEFIGTTASTFAASVNPGDAPARIEFGVRPLLADEAARAGAFDLDAVTVAVLARAMLVAALVFVAMSVIGLLIYLLVFRRRLPRARAMAAPPAHQSTQQPPTSGEPSKDG